jgi:hypothetical protein
VNTNAHASYLNKMVSGLNAATAYDHMAADPAFLTNKDAQNVIYVLGASATAKDLEEELLYLTNRKRTSHLLLLASESI